jgi:hypothetical protein
MIDAAFSLARDHWIAVASLSFVAGAAAMFLLILYMNEIAEHADKLRKQMFRD